MEKYLIITGGNKGIGKGIVLEYQKRGYQVVSIARTSNPSFEFSDVIQIQFDLSTIDDLESVFSSILSTINKDIVQRIILINNAGTLGKIGRVENNTASKIQNSIQLNTITPFLLTSIFLKETQNWHCQKKVINISSGAALKPYYGWSLYCASKAAINMMTKTIALEQETAGNGVKIIAISPGVVDTDMQAEIRKSTQEEFVDLQRFIDYKESGSLVDIETVGKKIFMIDQLNNYENGAILNISEYR
jgi:benzil reductase ((S)-benzoin forming)